MSDDDQRKPSLGDRFGRRTTAGGLAATGQNVIVPEPSQPSITQQLTGSLKEKPISFLLQMADHYEATGQLQIGGFQYTVTIQFGLGKPIHAFSPFNTGTEAILELFTWQDGKCSFTEGIQPQTPSVEESAPQILTLGDEYIRNMEFLQKLEITELSFLLRSPGKLSDAELEKTLLNGAPLNMKSQKEFYGNIYGTLNIKDIAQKMELSESRWMAIVANLLNLGLILTPTGKRLDETGYNVPAKPKPKPTAPQELKAMVAHDQQDHAGPSGTWPASPSGTWPTVPNAGTAPLMPPSTVFGGSAPPLQPPSFGTPPAATPQSNSPDNSWLGPNAQQATTHTFPTVHLPKTQQPLPQQSHSQLPPVTEPTSNQNTAPPPPPMPPPMGALAQAQKSFHLGIPQEIVTFDSALTEQMLAKMIRSETGILTHDAMLFFLEREFARAFRFSNSFTLMSFCITISATGWPVMPTDSMASLMGALNQMRRDVDMFGHFGERGFAFILPNVDGAQACGLVDRISQTLPQSVPHLSQFAPILHFGIASVPGDAKDVPTLVIESQQAMMEAAKRNVTRLRFSEINGAQ